MRFNLFNFISQSGSWLHAFVISAFGLKDMKISLLAMTLSLLTASIIPFLEKNIFYDVTLFSFLITVWFMDLISAIIRSYKRGGSFSTYKAMSAAAKFMAWVFIIFMFNFMHKFKDVVEMVSNGSESNGVLGKLLEYSQMSPAVVITYIIFIFALSTLKNFQLIDAFRGIKALDYFLYKDVDSYKNEEEDRLWNTLTEKQQTEIINNKR
jgi:hypothetical protein